MKKVKKYIYELAVKIVNKYIEDGVTKLTKEYLLNKGWVTEFDEVRQKIYYVESNIKDRDKISIEFGSNYYRVCHGKDRVFIALESSQEWFDMYYSLLIN